jgi:excinuclease ABC subunit C
VSAVASAPPPLPALRAEVRAGARNLPGTYRMLGEGGEILYVGKSKHVRARLLSYFRAREGEKSRRIIGEAHALKWSYAPSEFAALLHELELIKRHRPRFNVQHKRDGKYSFLKLASGAAPRLIVVGRVRDDEASYFGPFRGGRRIQEAVRELNDALGLRDCAVSTPMRFADQPDLFGLERTPLCHRAALSLCAGPCAGMCSRADYLRRVSLARAFLDGDADEPVRWLEARMHDASERWNFEFAARLRDRLRRLEMLRAEFGRLREALDCLSFVYTVPGHEGRATVYLIRRGRVRASMPSPRGVRQRRRLAELISEHYTRPEPDTALVARHEVDEILLIARWFRLRPDELARTAEPAEVAAGALDGRAAMRGIRVAPHTAAPLAALAP